jgi:hypothetical protein
LHALKWINISLQFIVKLIIELFLPVNLGWHGIARLRCCVQSTVMDLFSQAQIERHFSLLLLSRKRCYWNLVRLCLVSEVITNSWSGHCICANNFHLQEIPQKVLSQVSGLHHDRSQEYLFCRPYHVLFHLETLKIVTRGTFDSALFALKMTDVIAMVYFGFWISKGCGAKLSISINT